MAQQVIRKVPGPGEDLRWSGVPKQGLLLRFSDLWMVPFSLAWGGFALFWEFQAIQTYRQGTAPEALPMALFGIPFVLIGLYLIVGRFFFDAYRRKHTFYGLTDRRVIIVSGRLRQKVTSLPRESLLEVTLSEHVGGRGTIVFGRDAPLQLHGGRYIRGPRAPRFELIENAQQVYQQIMSGGE